MYDNPSKYLVGPKYNVDDAAYACKYPPGNSTLTCTTQPAKVQDSYLW